MKKILKTLVLFIFIVSTYYTYANSHAHFRAGLMAKNTIPSDDFIVITPPKCGTYLISKALTQITGKRSNHFRDYHLKDLPNFFNTLERCKNQNSYILSHLPADPEIVETLIKENYKVITIIRDPRDQIISAVYWILSGHDVDHLFDVPVKDFESLSFEEQVDELITGERYGFRLFDQLFRQHYPWLELGPEQILSIRFEDLVGPNGGGSRERQIQAVKQLAEWVNTPISEERIAIIADGLFGKSPTFRNGQINEWKDIFTQQQQDLFEKNYRDDLNYLGYP